MTAQEFATLAGELQRMKDAWYGLNKMLDKRDRPATIIGDGRQKLADVPVPFAFGYFQEMTGTPTMAEAPIMLVARAHRMSAFLREEIEWLEKELKTAIENRTITL